MLESILGLCHTIQAQNFKIEKKIGQLELDVEEMKSGNPKLPKAPRTCKCARVPIYGAFWVLFHCFCHFVTVSGAKLSTSYSIIL